MDRFRDKSSFERVSMFSNYLKFSGLMALGSLACFSLMVGCKNAENPLGHQGPFDVPTSTFTITATPTITNTPTATSTPGPVNVSCYVNYGGSQSGVSWNLVDPNGNTVNTTAQSSGGTPFLFTLSAYGSYSVNIPTQTKYLYSTQPLTITGPGNYSVTFTCSGQTLSVNPTFFNYSSVVGYQTPVTVSYSYSGNLDVPVSVQTSGLDSSFSVLPSYVILNNSGSSGILNVSKNICDTNNTSLNFTAYGLIGSSTVATSNTSINRGYSIPVSFLFSYGGSYYNCGTQNGSVAITIFAVDGGLNCSSTPYMVQGSPVPSGFGGGITPSSFSANLSNTVNYVFTSTFSGYTNSSDSNNLDYPVTFNIPGGTQLTGVISIHAPNQCMVGNATSPLTGQSLLIVNSSY
jgi:hypothetical protein